MRDIDAEKFARKANPLTAEERVIDAVSAIPDMSCPKDWESDTETEVAIPLRSWSTDGESEIEADMVAKKASAVVSRGDRPIVRALVTPSIPWLIVGLSETEAERPTRNAASPARVGLRATETD